MGLLEPSTGHIYADSVDVKEPGNYRKWLKNIGYIPQMIFMLDDTIRKNVAFGVPEDKIDEDSWMNLSRLCRKVWRLASASGASASPEDRDSVSVSPERCIMIRRY